MMPDPNPHSRFEAWIRNLNHAQRVAVEALEGPVWVLAGPGTGKTHIIAARIGMLLLNTDTQAHNILCLTFTDAGVTAMRQRLMQLIGATAHQVHIYTYHSFCNRIIQENLYLFGKRELEPASELDRLEVVTRLLNQLDYENPLISNRRNPHFFAPHLIHLFQTMKREHWSPDYIRKKCQAFIEMLPEQPAYQYRRNYKQFKKGDPKPALIEKVSEQMRRLMAAVELFEPYNKSLKAKKRYDYEDMIGWVLTAFDQHPMLLRRYQEQYLYILSDEYQDTNGAQHEILMRLIQYWDVPNLFLVGDDDQAIYEFQGARLQHLFSFHDQFQDTLTTIVLQENYRSAQGILDVAEAVIEHNELRAVNLQKDINKHLTAAHPARLQQTAAIAILEFEHPVHEWAWLINRIIQLQQQGVDLDEIAVIYARHSQSEPLIALLQKSGIPFTTKAQADVLRMKVTEQWLRWLQYFNRESQAPYSATPILFQLLHHPHTGISQRDLAKLSLQAGSSEEFVQAFNQVDSTEQAYFTAPALVRMSHFIQQGFQQWQCLSPTAFMEWVLNKSGLLSFAYQLPDAGHQLEVLNSFMQFAEREVSKQSTPSLPELLDLVAQMKAHRIQVPLVSAKNAGKGVQLLTAHSAKGLEFEFVFIFNALSDYWEPKQARGLYQFPLPDNLTLSTPETDAEEGRRRLFYVAMSRAKSGLYITYSVSDLNGKQRTRSRFIDEIVDGTHHQVTLQTVANAQVQAIHNLSLQISEKPPVASLLDKDLLNDRLASYRMSISGLNTYLRCPLSFYYEQVLRVPIATSEEAAYGLAVHATLERYFRKSRTKNRVKPLSAKQFLALFQSELQLQRAHFAPQSYNHYLEMGKHHLLAFYQQHLVDLPEDSLLEYHLTNVTYRSVPLVGNIDRIDMLPQLEARIIDYKTGKFKGKYLRTADDKFPKGGDYWRQLVFYKILYENWPHADRLVTQGELLSIDQSSGGKLQSHHYALAATDTKLVGDLIEQSYKDIMSHEFAHGCGEPDCVWCSLERHSALPDTLSREEIIGLDD